MLIRSSQTTPEVRENMRGGAGRVSINHITQGADLPRNVRLAAEIRLEPGCSIGWHVHEQETELFYFASGSGKASDNGADVAVAAGDCLITPSGCGHSVDNTGSVPLVFFAVIVLN